MKRKATAFWRGTGKEGKGHLSTQSGFLDQTPYSAGSRFEQSRGTNPEELVAAAHSGCFTMKLAFVLAAAGFTADELETTSEVTLDNGIVTSSALTLKAKIEGISDKQFAEAVADAKQNCPISKLLKTEITVDFQLN